MTDAVQRMDISSREERRLLEHVAAIADAVDDRMDIKQRSDVAVAVQVIDELAQRMAVVRDGERLAVLIISADCEERSWRADALE